MHSIQHNAIHFVSDLRQVGDFLQVCQFPPPIKLMSRYYRNIVESGIKHHKPKPKQNGIHNYMTISQFLQIQIDNVLNTIYNLNNSTFVFKKYNFIFWNWSKIVLDISQKNYTSSSQSQNCHNITEILLKVALKTIILTLTPQNEVCMEVRFTSTYTIINT